MIKALSLAAAIVVLPTGVWAQDRPAPTAANVCVASVDASDLSIDDEIDDADMTPSVRRLAQAARDLGERMETFGTRAGAICENQALSDDEKESRISALWAEYEPDMASFTALAGSLGQQIASETTFEIDLGTLVEEAMVEVQSSGAIQGAMGIAQNSAWTSGDPEHMATMLLVADYAVGEATDAIEEASAELAAATDQVEVEVATSQKPAPDQD